MFAGWTPLHRTHGQVCQPVDRHRPRHDGLEPRPRDGKTDRRNPGWRKTKDGHRDVVAGTVRLTAKADVHFDYVARRPTPLSSGRSKMKKSNMNWRGVIPAMTTAFRPDLSVDRALIGRHARWMVDNGCTGIVALGSLGESATLRFDEKVAILKTVVGALDGKAPVVAGIASLSTLEAVDLAHAAADAGCSGLMVLPPYVYSSDWREMESHVQPVIRATKLSCMLYNNPVSYKTDFLPGQIKELAAAHPNLHAVKESS